MKKIFYLCIMMIVIISCQSAKEKAIQSVDETLKHYMELPKGVDHLSFKFSPLLLNYKYYLCSDWTLEANEGDQGLIVTAFVTRKNGFGVESHDKVYFKINPKDYSIENTQGFFALDDIPEKDLLWDLDNVKKWDVEKYKIIIEKSNWNSDYGVANFDVVINNKSQYVLSNLKLRVDFYDNNKNVVGTETTTIFNNAPLNSMSKRGASFMISLPSGATRAGVNINF
ncbi:MAG: hypothetical protein Q7U54_07945 [Bacteroidales bacterium]|nr:hypothetical protein [Bacteroidales bacterium]